MLRQEPTITPTLRRHVFPVSWLAANLDRRDCSLPTGSVIDSFADRLLLLLGS